MLDRGFFRATLIGMVNYCLKKFQAKPWTLTKGDGLAVILKINDLQFLPMDDAVWYAETWKSCIDNIKRVSDNTLVITTRDPARQDRFLYSLNQTLPCYEDKIPLGRLCPGIV